MKLTHPHDFPKMLLPLLPNVARGRDEFLPREAFQDPFYRGFEDAIIRKKSNYKTTFRALAKKMATPYMIAARGMYGLKSLDHLEKLAAPRYKSEGDMSVSQNVYAASGHFGRLMPGLRKTGYGMSALIIFKFRPENLKEYGGDSESGSLHEAEIKATGCWKCVDRIYVMAKKRVGKPVTEAERKLYGLSSFVMTGPTIHTMVTALPLSMLPNVKAVKGLKFKVTTKPPTGWKWYRVK